MSCGLAFEFEYLYCLSIREDGRPRYVRTDRLDFCTVGPGPLEGSLGGTNGTAVTLGKFDGSLIPSGWYLDTLDGSGGELKVCTR